MTDEWHDDCPKGHGEYRGDECPSCADEDPWFTEDEETAQDGLGPECL